MLSRFSYVLVLLALLMGILVCMDRANQAFAAEALDEALSSSGAGSEDMQKNETRITDILEAKQISQEWHAPQNTDAGNAQFSIEQTAPAEAAASPFQFQTIRMNGQSVVSTINPESQEVISSVHYDESGHILSATYTDAADDSKMEIARMNKNEFQIADYDSQGNLEGTHAVSLNSKIRRGR